MERKNLIKKAIVIPIDEYFECYSNQDMKGMESYYPEDVGEQIGILRYPCWDIALKRIIGRHFPAYYGDPFTIHVPLMIQRLSRTLR